MTYAKAPHRLGTTAIAAVIALTATPLFAQSADTVPADVATPVLVTPAPVVAPAPAPAAQTATPSSITGVVTAPVVTGAGTGTNLAQTPRIDIDDAADVTPVAAKTVAAPAPQTARTAPVTRVTAPVTKAATSPMPAPATEVLPVAAPRTAAVDKPIAAPVPAPQPAAAAAAGDDLLPIAGVAGIGALALIGGALALRRRKRDDEDVVFEEAEVVPETMVAAPIVTAPVYARDLRDTPALMPATAAATDLPAGFDISRYGRHVQAAYRGPTADNPSLSLKNRLKRASFYDQRERMAAMPQQAQAEIPAAATTMDRTQPIPARRPDPVVSRPTRQPNFRPVFQS